MDYKVTWHRLDLANVVSMAERVRLIKDWGRLGARAKF
jgi:hypothetical protein